MTEETDDGTDPNTQMGSFGFTIWDKSTGVILKHGTSSFLWGATNQVEDPDTQSYWGEELDGDKWAFDPITKEPYEADKALSQQELRIAINRHRDVLITKGKVFNGIRVTGSDKDRSNLESLAFGSQLRLGMGDTALRPFRDGDDIIHMLSPLDFLGLWGQAAQYVSDIYEKSWELKALPVIPQDIEDPAHWPTI